MSVYHPVGSMKMGPSSDPMTVADSELCVHSIEGLRVVDASIFPMLLSGNTHAPTVAVAERGRPRRRALRKRHRPHDHDPDGQR
jgi:choline dehydrogenase